MSDVNLMESILNLFDENGFLTISTLLPLMILILIFLVVMIRILKKDAKSLIFKFDLKNGLDISATYYKDK